MSNRLAYLTLRQPSMIGTWRKGCLHGKVTHIGGVSHETIICETVVKHNAIQSNNSLTTKQHCNVKDLTVTEVMPLANTLSKSGLDKTQFLAWKDNEPKVTREDVNANFYFRRFSTVEEDKNFRK